MPKTRRRRKTRRTVRRKRRQRGGVLPLAAALPVLVAAGKAAGLGALGGAASYGAQRALKRVLRGKGRSQRTRPYDYEYYDE